MPAEQNIVGPENSSRTDEALESWRERTGILYEFVVSGESKVRALLEHVMNLAEKPHQDADFSVSSVPCRSPVFRISKPLLSKFITASRLRALGSAQGDAWHGRRGPSPGSPQSPRGGQLSLGLALRRSP